MLNILLVEDEQSTAESLIAAMESLVDANIKLVTHRDDAVSLIREEDFDLVICDLRIPPREGTAELDSRYGLEVHQVLREVSPGTPSLFFTGVNDAVLVRDALQDQDAHDIFGRHQPHPLVALLFKDQVRECLQTVREFSDQSALLDQIEILPEELSETLDPRHKRILRIFARRNDGRTIQIDLKRGMSGTDTLVATVRNAANQTTARVFCKIGGRTRISEERSAFSQNVAQLLPSHAFAPLIDIVTAGAGRRAGLFFSIASGYDADFFALVQDASAIACTQATRDTLKPWAALETVAERRMDQLLPSDVDIPAVERVLGRDAPVCKPEFWASTREVRLARQHGDLHGENILTGGPSSAYLIDFADADILPACLDPLTLEFSLLFHKNSPLKAHAWPSPEQAASWYDLPTYLRDCPCPDLVAFLRGWAEEDAGSEDEMRLVALVHVLRQAKYDDTDKMLIRAVAQGLMGVLGL